MIRQIGVLRIGLVLLLQGFLGMAVMAAETAELQPSPFALPAERAPVVVAEDSCANACQAEHNRCRVSTKGSPSCDEARQRCLQACIANKKSGR